MSFPLPLDITISLIIQSFPMDGRHLSNFLSRIAMQQRSQNQIPVKREEILHGDGDNGVGTGATSASVYPMTPTPPPRGLEPMLPLSPSSSPSSGHSYVPPNSDHYAIHSVDTSSRMSLQSILHPSSEDQVSKSLLTTPLIRPIVRYYSVVCGPHQ